MDDSIKRIGFVVICFLILWGVDGLIRGNGFFGGIAGQIEAITNIVFFIVIIGLILGGIWLVRQYFNPKK